jgi:hypothetical protein
MRNQAHIRNPFVVLYATTWSLECIKGNLISSVIHYGRDALCRLHMGL